MNINQAKDLLEKLAQAIQSAEASGSDEVDLNLGLDLAVSEDNAARTELQEAIDQSN
jgi:enolase